MARYNKSPNTYIVDIDGTRLSLSAIQHKIQEAISKELAEQKKSKYTEKRDKYTKDVIKAVEDRMLKYMSILQMTELIETEYSDLSHAPNLNPLRRNADKGTRGSRYGLFIEQSIFGIPSNSYNGPDIQQEGFMKEKGIEIKGSLGQAELHVGGITLFKPLNSAHTIGSERGEKFLANNYELHLIMLQKMYSKMQTLLLIYEKEKLKDNNKWGVGFTLIRLYYMLSLKNLYDSYIQKNKHFVSIKKSSDASYSVNRTNLSQTYDVVIKLDTAKPFDKFTDLYEKFHDFVNENGFNGGGKISQGDFFKSMRELKIRDMGDNRPI